MNVKNSSFIQLMYYTILDFIPVIIELILHDEAKRRNTEDDKGEKDKLTRKIDIKRVFLSDLMLLLNHNLENCR